MAGQPIKYIVTNNRTGEKFETMAVSELDASNKIHYRLWFGRREWCDMEDLEAVADVILRFRKLKYEK